MEIYFDVYFKGKDVAFSNEFYQQFGSNIASGLKLDTSGIYFYLFQPKLGKVTGHLLTEKGYIKAKINKKNGSVKKQSVVRYARMTIEQQANAIGSGLAYRFKFSESGVDEEFSIQYEYDNPEEIDRECLGRFLEGLRQGISSSKNTNVEVPSVDAVIGGDVQFSSGNLITVNEKRMKKTLQDLEKGGVPFLSLAGIPDLDSVVFCDRTKIFGILEYYLFLEDKIIILKKVSKDLSQAESRTETSYKDINRVERGSRALFNKSEDFSDFVFSLKSGMKEICTLSGNLKQLLNTGGVNSQNSSDFSILEKILKGVLKQSVISPQSCADSAISIIENWNREFGTKDFILRLKEGLAPIALLAFFETGLSKEKADSLFTSFNQVYLKCLKRLKGIAEGSDLDKAKQAVAHLEFIDDIHNYSRLILKTTSPGLPDYPSWNLGFMDNLNKKLKRNRQNINTSYAVAVTQGLLLGAVWGAVNDIRLANFLEKWSKDDLTTEISRLERMGDFRGYYTCLY